MMDYAGGNKHISQFICDLSYAESFPEKSKRT